MSQTLAVLAIRPATFHTLFYSEKLTQLKLLFDEALTERINSYHHRKEAAELLKKQGTNVTVPNETTTKQSQLENFGVLLDDNGALFIKISKKAKKSNKDYHPYVDDSADLNTIHEAYQYLMKTYVDDVLELKTKHQRLTQALEILNIAHLKFHTLYLSEKLEEMRKLLDSAMIERVKEFHHIKQTAELNSIKLTRDDFEPFLMKITRKLRGPRKNFQTQRQFNHIRNQALKELRLYTCEDDCESQDSNGKRIKSAKKKKLKKQKSKEEPEPLDPLIGE